MKTFSLILLLPVLFMFLCEVGLFRFSDRSTIQNLTFGSWTEYAYISAKTGQSCGTVYSGKYTHPDGSATGYAYPTQWWNFSMLSGRRYDSIEKARQEIEKFCPTK